MNNSRIIDSHCLSNVLDSMRLHADIVMSCKSVLRAEAVKSVGRAIYCSEIDTSASSCHCGVSVAR